ncbi:DEAD/DEAH box helicase [Actinospica robiniae]|uniref:DEAD/DEAH box helicase n=1 Tax=Actinospica robiniae TaxID=304901 RepID=UPI00041AF5C1|nr:DEAD/DEAH box helicase [Actinospica robiniae]
MPRSRTAEEILRRLVFLGGPSREGSAVHVEQVDARLPRYGEWPQWADPLLVERLMANGVERPWSHQVEAAELLHAGRHTVLSTGTASGKSAGYLLPALSRLLGDAEARSKRTPAPVRASLLAPSEETLAPAAPSARQRAATVLYLAPTKALAADQARRLRELDLPLPPAVCLDGDTTAEERRWIREYGRFVLSNPDMLHYSMLPDHRRWAGFLRRLAYVVVDECHGYRGVFGAHVSAVLRRLRRLCAYYGADPIFALASATTADPQATASRLTGLDVEAVTEDGSPRGRMLFALWEPPLTDARGERGAPTRRTAVAETATLLADLAGEQVRTVAFIRSRRGAELVSIMAREQLERSGVRGEQVAAYRAGYLREDRRALEAALQSGRLTAVAATNALELGVDIAGLDAVVMAGYPGTRASLWQQAGRAGRTGQEALAVLVARDDPLDTYLVHHPEALFGKPVEATVFDPGNPYVLWGHLCAAAAELPLRKDDLDLFGPGAHALAEELGRTGWLRKRADGWYWTRPERAADLSDLRGSGAEPVRIIEADTGRLLGMADGAAAAGAVHPGAVYLHQGESYLVRDLDLDASIALVEAKDPGYATYAREQADVRILKEERVEEWNSHCRIAYGTVAVTSRVVGYLKRDSRTGQVLGEEPLDLPEHTLTTKAVWWTVTPAGLEEALLGAPDVPGAAHAAEHASIGLLPLFADCDRWDLGGLSAAEHPDTGLATVFVHDGLQGGAGFAERGFAKARDWLTATRDAIAACECRTGCPSCVQSPKCGNGNEPLDKTGAIRLLEVLLKPS